MVKKKSIHSLYGRFQNIMRLSEALDKIPRKFGTDTPLTSSEAHLIELAGDNEGRSVTDLARLLGVTKGAVSQNLKRLESKGFIIKEEDPSNISRSNIRLTNKGKTVYYSHKDWHDTMDGGFKDYFQSLEQEKIDFLDEFLVKVETFFKQRIKTEK